MIFGLRRGFTSSRRGVQLRLDAPEAEVLAEMLNQLDSWSAPVRIRRPATTLWRRVRGRRLRPPRGSRHVAAVPGRLPGRPRGCGEFRRLHPGRPAGAEVPTSADLAGVWTGSPQRPTRSSVDLTDDEASGFLVTLNDLRLVLGVRLGIVADDQDVVRRLGDDDPGRATYAAYQWLTWLQAESARRPVAGRKDQ